MSRLLLQSTQFAIGAWLLLAATTVGAAITEEFDVSSGGQLIVDADSAKLIVKGVGGDQVKVNVSRKDDDAEAIHDDYLVEFSQQGDDVSISVKKRRSLGSWFFSRSLVIAVDIPGEFNIDLQTSGGSVQVSQLVGDMKARTSGGTLSFEEVDGPIYGRTSGGSIKVDATGADVDLKTSGGSIRAGNVGGKVEAKTSGGSITIERAGGIISARTSGGPITVGEAHASVQAKTSGGSIQVGMAAQPGADSRLSTSGGSVTVRLDPGLSLAIDAKTSGGRVNSELPVTVQGTFSKSQMVGDLNDGGPLLELRSSGGSINIRTL